MAASQPLGLLEAPLLGQRQADDECECACVLASLRFVAPAPPAQVVEPRRRPAATASASHDPTDSEGEDVEYRPSKVRVMPAASSSSPTAAPLARRTYTWRGVSTKRAEKQRRQLEALAAAQAGAAPGDAAASPAASSGSAGSTGMPSPTAEAAAAATARATQLVAAQAEDSGKEGDRDWAALTTWLRMNIHNPRTAKKVVLFVGTRDAATGRWAFGLNPRLSWADVSPDARRRLRHLPDEAAKAFSRKYRSRPPADWRLKSQKYKPPNSSQSHLVLLDDLVLTLHALWQQHEGAIAAATAAADAATAAPQGSSEAMAGGDAAASTGDAGSAGGAASSGAHSAAAAAGDDQLASCGTSAPQQPQQAPRAQQ
ncbi:hypothetical protein C2E20_6166 [Micractinium conductrix]|uniref:Uncharacterized protein n=1 Tax=Micractinium conductrix TaxID=554055 RepID=A0A2P6V8M6_9CHLO|nr:hypothetical protein C2E20_6166 [Micractinium conductrix]|eukprot:PSC70444.1 hypothetical protein C2E20_6166 [Micractinium conductrix]